jgi:hypothetical protein
LSRGRQQQVSPRHAEELEGLVGARQSGFVRMQQNGQFPVYPVDLVTGGSDGEELK